MHKLYQEQRKINTHTLHYQNKQTLREKKKEIKNN